MASIADDHKCQYTYLGNSGLRVSNICLGALTFGETQYGLPGQLEEGASHQMINRFVEWGGNFIDTANVYGLGNSEKIVGSWLAGQERDRFVIATKVRSQMDESNPNACGLGRRHIIQSVEDSLKRLKTDYIDLLQTHAWDDAVPIEETLLTLNDLVRCGKVRYLGASNVTGWQLQKIVDISKQNGYSPFISLQQQYSLVSRESELEPFQVCKLNGLGVLPWSPLKGGFLTGKVKRDKVPEEGRLGWAMRDNARNVESAPYCSAMNTERNWAILDTVDRIARAKGKSIAQVSLRWLLQKPVVSSVIIGATKMAQLDENMAAANGWQLSPQETHAWDDAVPIEETLLTLNDLVRCGKVRYLGASNVTGWQLQKIVDISKQNGYSPFISLQQQYSLVSRESELEPFQVCKLNGLGVLPWSPLKGGFLTGKVKRDKVPEEGRLGWAMRDNARNVESAPYCSAMNTERNWAILDTVDRIARAKGKSIAQVSLRWLLQKPVVSSVIIGATKMAQLDENMAAANGWQLSPQEMKELDEVTKPDVLYPYEMIRRLNGGRVNPWNPFPYV